MWKSLYLCLNSIHIVHETWFNARCSEDGRKPPSPVFQKLHYGKAHGRRGWRMETQVNSSYILMASLPGVFYIHYLIIIWGLPSSHPHGVHIIIIPFSSQTVILIFHETPPGALSSSGLPVSSPLGDFPLLPPRWRLRQGEVSCSSAFSSLYYYFTLLTFWTRICSSSKCLCQFSWLLKN